MSLLRSAGKLTPDTLRDYYGATRFEQVAESNALEGSTLSAGETELAVLKGITTTGHDPAYVRDAIALDRALARLVDLAKQRDSATDIEQLHEIHGLLLGDRPGAGAFRTERVMIRGARHVPPKTWRDVMDQMEHWENWSRENADAPAPLRAAVLHAWLAHIHPYIDGNGRTARAVGNLELIRSGYPPIIIKKKERLRYIESLASSDDAGDLRAFAELIFDRVESSLVGVEASARRKQGFSPELERLRRTQEQYLTIWRNAVQLLASIVGHNMEIQLEQLRGKVMLRHFQDNLDLDDYLELSEGRPVRNSWAFQLSIEIPALPVMQRLAFAGHRSSQMFQHLGRRGGPSLFWSIPSASGLSKWEPALQRSPFAVEMTTEQGNGNEWIVRLLDNSIRTLQTTELAQLIAKAALRAASEPA